MGGGGVGGGGGGQVAETGGDNKLIKPRACSYEIKSNPRSPNPAQH